MITVKSNKLAKRPWADKFRKRLVKNTTPAHQKAALLLKYLYKGKISIALDVKITPSKGGKKHKYYLDILLSDAKLAIEIDGGVHDTSSSSDWKRDETIMNYKKVLIIRFPNEIILYKPKEFLQKVNETLIQRVLFISNSDMFNNHVNNFLNQWRIPEMRFMDGVRQFVKEAKALQSRIDSFQESDLTFTQPKRIPPPPIRKAALQLSTN